jgi:hypothetical protein
METLGGFPVRVNFAGRIEGVADMALPAAAVEQESIPRTIVQYFRDTPEFALIEPYLSAQQMEHWEDKQLYCSIQLNDRLTAWRGFLELRLYDDRLLDVGVQADGLARLISECSTALATIVSGTLAQMLPASEGMARTIAAADPVTVSRLAAAPKPAPGLSLPNQITVRYATDNALAEALKAAKKLWRIQALAVVEALVILAMGTYILRAFFFDR